MKVLFINTVFGKGSTGRIVKQLGDTIEAEGGEYLVAYGRGGIVDQKHSYFIGSQLDRYMHAGVSRITDRAGFYSKKCTKKFISFIKEYNPDIIHLHNLHGYYINLPVLFGYFKDEYKGRIIWTLHDCWAFTGHCTHFTYAKCEKWKTGCSNCPERGNYPVSCLLDNSSINYKQKKELFSGFQNLTIVTVSEWLKRVVQESFLGQYEIRRIYNGIDVERFKAVATNLRIALNLVNKRIILCVSDGWNERKGWGTIIKTAQAAPDNWVFILIGATKKQIKSLPSNVMGIEHIWNQNELMEYYSIADVFFNPSVEETFGLVTAEAMACGTQAVVFNSTACPELIGNKYTGIVLDTTATIETILEALKNPGDSKLTREWICNNFNQDIFINNYSTLYVNR